jgi:hypothetical protein
LSPGTGRAVILDMLAKTTARTARLREKYMVVENFCIGQSHNYWLCCVLLDVLVVDVSVVECLLSLKRGILYVACGDNVRNLRGGMKRRIFAPTSEEVI